MAIPMNADGQVAVAFWVGICVTAMSLALLAVVLVLRQLAQRRERNHLRATAFWKQLLGEAMRAPPAQAPALPWRDMTGFMDAWNELHDAPGGADNAGMRAVAERIGLAPKLERMLDRGSFHDRVMAIIAIGHLRSASSFDRLTELVGDASPIISISAARAMMRIDAARAVQKVVPQIEARHDWVDGGIAQMLHEAGPDAIRAELGAAVLRANDDVAPRLVRFLAGISREAATPVIGRILAEPHDEHLVSTCLQVMSELADLDKVRPLLTHPRWHVRMHAAAAIGRLGGADDAAALEPLLADPQWWVRYRTAQALEHLFRGDAARLERLRDAQEDRYARDIVTQVMAERALGETR
ncbi:HEAT repeat domain-containing protein [Thermomonas brevis]|uniref:HEAT repeat domain-containing protein n=1 Tax=Thermomonas brevis TaxID=215691 RepID=A0A7G9QQB4_9GAMM|nr:HEAT repeat domain-containing protein [Thermomonas brevis]QNN45539.1 HEAT repeat domain-containing protein [Thermomonas brevis]